MYHVMNRAVGKLPPFGKEADYEAFERLMLEAWKRCPTRILAWCLMKTHWRWSSLWAWQNGREELKGLLSDWPVDRPADWVDLVHEAVEAKELQRLEECERRGRPYGGGALATQDGVAAGAGAHRPPPGPSQEAGGTTRSQCRQGVNTGASCLDAVLFRCPGVNTGASC